MGSNHALEIEVENRLANLATLVESMDADRDQLSFSRKDFMHELRDKVKASRQMFRVAKLLSEPARESMFSKVCDSLSDVEGCGVPDRPADIPAAPASAGKRVVPVFVSYHRY